MNTATFAELLADIHHTAVHLELRDLYAVGDETDDYAAFLRTGVPNLDPARSFWPQRMRLVQGTVARGVVMRRARIVSEPVLHDLQGLIESELPLDRAPYEASSPPCSQGGPVPGPLTRSGAVLGSTSVILAAVRPEALQGVLATSATIAAGATGLWPTSQAFADGKPKRTNGKWHYVWVLQRKAAH
ncbi:DUF6879 family protein [Streptomyces niveus]|uniref:DUF6879 family protein n=1 Tax=Streptomyces niveus TaxID=193462 RepID=UPI00367780FB